MRAGALLLAATFAIGVGSARSTGPDGRLGQCRAKDLRRTEPWPVFQPAGSDAEGVIRFRNTSRRACILPLHVQARFVAPGHGQRVQQFRQWLWPGEVALRKLRPHRTALLRILWENWCGPGSNSLGRPGTLPRALVIGRAGARPLFRLPVNGSPPCQVPSQPSTVAVTVFFRVVHVVG